MNCIKNPPSANWPLLACEIRETARRFPALFWSAVVCRGIKTVARRESAMAVCADLFEIPVFTRK